jgi:hypothetical protein
MSAKYGAQNYACEKFRRALVPKRKGKRTKFKGANAKAQVRNGAARERE